MTKNLTHELGKVGCELESSKEERLIRWIRSNDTKHLAKFRSRRLLGPGRFPQTVRHFWMLARNARRGRHNGQAKDHGYAHQHLQICRSMEVQTRFFSDQEDIFPISDQRSGIVKMRTNVHYRQCSSLSPTLRGSWWKHHQFELEASKSQVPGT